MTTWERLSALLKSQTLQCDTSYCTDGHFLVSVMDDSNQYIAWGDGEDLETAINAAIDAVEARDA